MVILVRSKGMNTTKTTTNKQTNKQTNPKKERNKQKQRTHGEIDDMKETLTAQRIHVEINVIKGFQVKRNNKELTVRSMR